jgi:hypothetical protein
MQLKLKMMAVGETWRYGTFESRCKTRWKKIMAKITAYIPEPKQEYDVENQRQILQSDRYY